MPRYLEFYGLTGSPFRAHAIRPLVLETGPLRRAVGWIRAEIEAGTPHLCLSGLAGVGKSSLAMALPHVVDRQVACISDPTRPWGEIEAGLTQQLELKAYVVSQEALLEAQATSNRRALLVVDDAERIPAETRARLEELLDFDDEAKHSLLQIVLICNLEAVAEDAGGAPWVQHVHPRNTLDPLLPRELRRYVEARLANAGWQGDDLFPPETLQAIHGETAGIPRAVDDLCERLLEVGAERALIRISADLVATVSRDLPAPAGDQADLPALPRPAAKSAPEAELPSTRTAPQAAKAPASRPVEPAPVRASAPEPEPAALSHKAALVAAVALRELRERLPESLPRLRIPLPTALPALFTARVAGRAPVWAIAAGVLLVVGGSVNYLQSERLRAGASARSLPAAPTAYEPTQPAEAARPAAATRAPRVRYGTPGRMPVPLPERTVPAPPPHALSRLPWTEPIAARTEVSGRETPVALREPPAARQEPPVADATAAPRREVRAAIPGVPAKRAPSDAADAAAPPGDATATARARTPTLPPAVRRAPVPEPAATQGDALRRVRWPKRLRRALEEATAAAPPQVDLELPDPDLAGLTPGERPLPAPGEQDEPAPRSR